MKRRRDPRLQTARDVRAKERRIPGVERPYRTPGERTGKKERPKPKEQRPKERPRSKPKRPKGKAPPAPWFLGAAAGFSVLLILGIFLNYYKGLINILSILFLLLSLVCVGATIFYAIEFYTRNSRQWPTRSKISAIGAAAIVISGVLIGSYIFVIKEPYNDWDYQATLSCTVDCVIEIPIPLKDNRTAFFDEGAVRTDGAGFVEIKERRYEGEDILVLEVSWSGNFSLRVSNNKDYRPLPMEYHGLWNSTQEEFVVVGRKIPTDQAPSFELSFSHRYFSQYPDHEEWTIDGEVSIGVNFFEPDMS